MNKTICMLLLGVTMFSIVGCSKKLDDAAVQRTLVRFVTDYDYARSHGAQSIKSVGQIVLKNDNEAEVPFIINSRYGEVHANATFNRTQDGKWVFTRANGDNWGIRWSSDSGELGWEVK
jgi:hypothetical protein